LGSGFKALSNLVPLKINPAGEAELELGRQFLDGVLFRQPGRYIIRLHSNRYEGCLELNTRPDVTPVSATFRIEETSPIVNWAMHPVGTLVLHNPNDTPVTVVVGGNVSYGPGLEPAQPCYQLGSGVVNISKLKCVNKMRDEVAVGSNSTAEVAIYGAFHLGGLSNRQLQVAWSVETMGIPGELIPTTVPTSVIP